MKFIDSNEVNRRVVRHPLWEARRAAAEEAAQRLNTAHAALAEAQSAVSELYNDVINELIAEMGDGS